MTYPLTDIAPIARRFGCTSEHVYRIIEGGKTHSVVLAASIAKLTGESAKLYLVEKGVAIDPVPVEDWSWEKVDERFQVSDLPDLDLLQLHREVLTLAAEIAVEMKKRIVRPLPGELALTLEVLKECQWVRRIAASKLGVSPRTMTNRLNEMKELGVVIPGSVSDSWKPLADRNRVSSSDAEGALPNGPDESNAPIPFWVKPC